MKSPRNDLDESPGRRRVRQARNIFVITALLTVAAVVALFLTENVTPEMVRVDAAAEYDGETFRIIGSTSLPAGAILGYNVLSHDGESVTKGFHVIESGRLEVMLQRSDLTGGEPDRVRLSFEVVMADRLQPPEIVERYGSRGQRMTSDTVQQVPHGQRLIWTVPVRRE